MQDGVLKRNLVLLMKYGPVDEKSTKNYIYCPHRTFRSSVDSNGYDGKWRVR